MPEVCAFYARSLVILSGYGLKCRNINQHAIAHITPYGYGRKAINYLRGNSQRTGHAGKRHEHIGVHIAPYLCGGNQGHRKRHEKQRADHVVKAAAFPDHQRQSQPEDVCAKDIDDGKMRRMQETVLKRRAFQKFDVVFQADEIPALCKDGLFIGERNRDALDKGNQYHKREQRKGRQHEQDIAPVFSNGISGQLALAIQTDRIYGRHNKSAPALLDDGSSRAASPSAEAGGPK